jgi:hypothetical protein
MTASSLPIEYVQLRPPAIQTEYAATAWAAVDCFGGVKVTEELNGANIHHLGNVMTMEANVHMKFDSLAIWFEETVCYVIKSLGGNDLLQMTRTH